MTRINSHPWMWIKKYGPKKIKWMVKMVPYTFSKLCIFWIIQGSNSVPKRSNWHNLGSQTWPTKIKWFKTYGQLGYDPIEEPGPIKAESIWDPSKRVGRARDSFQVFSWPTHRYRCAKFSRSTYSVQFPIVGGLPGRHYSSQREV